MFNCFWLVLSVADLQKAGAYTLQPNNIGSYYYTPELLRFQNSSFSPWSNVQTRLDSDFKQLIHSFITLRCSNDIIQINSVRSGSFSLSFQAGSYSSLRLDLLMWLSMFQVQKGFLIIILWQTRSISQFSLTTLEVVLHCYWYAI